MGSLATPSRKNEKVEETYINLLRIRSFKNKNQGRAQVNNNILQNFDGFGLFKALFLSSHSSAHSYKTSGADIIIYITGQFLLLLLYFV